MERIYYEDVYINKFKACVLDCQPLPSGRYAVTLDRTAFYPEGGGQPADTGHLGTVRVLDVHEKSGQIFHETDGPLQPGTEIQGDIDWEWRYENMQHHSGEHLLSGLIHQRFGYDNVGFHMGRDEVTIDFNGSLTPEELKAVEEEANRMIYDNIPIEAWYPEKDVLDDLEYRSKKELTGPIRIVRIAGGDICACCGTHVRTTGEIGIIKATGMIHYKSGVRITILCGLKAWLDYCRKQEWITALSVKLSAKQELVADAVVKLAEESGQKDMVINRLYEQLFELKTSGYEESSQPLLVIEEGLSPVFLRKYCTMLMERGKGSAILVCSGAGNFYQYAAGSRQTDIRGVGKKLNSLLNGRGGGSAVMVQGTFSASEKKIKEAWNALHKGDETWN